MLNPDLDDILTLACPLMYDSKSDLQVKSIRTHCHTIDFVVRPRGTLRSEEKFGVDDLVYDYDVLFFKTRGTTKEALAFQIRELSPSYEIPEKSTTSSLTHIYYDLLLEKVKVTEHES